MRRQKGNRRLSTSQIKFVNEGYDETKRRYFLVSIHRDGQPILIALDELITNPGPIYKVLVNAGWNGLTQYDKTSLLKRFKRFKAKRLAFKVVTQLGWIGRDFVLPGEIFGKRKRRVERNFTAIDSAMLSKYRRRGTLDKWKQIAILSRDNSRLMFCLSVAFTGPMLRFSDGPRSGGFQLTGESGSGKTTAALVAGTVWGCHKGERGGHGFMESWNTTPSKAELTAFAHNCVVLILDETRLAAPDLKGQAKAVFELIFRLSERHEKERMPNSGPARSWSMYFLSTSNNSIMTLAAALGQEADDALRGRCLDIPLPEGVHGIFECLNGIESPELLADHFQVLSKRYFGTAGPEFVRRVVQWAHRDREDLCAFIRLRRRRYRAALRKAVEGIGLPILNRPAARCATVYAAGSLAIRFGILPWERKALLDAIIKCHIDAIIASTGTVPQSVQSLRTRFTDWLKANQKGFMDLGEERPQAGVNLIDAAPGFVKAHRGQRRLFLLPESFEHACGSVSDADKVRKELTQSGVMQRPKKGFLMSQRIHKKATTKVYVLELDRLLATDG